MNISHILRYYLYPVWSALSQRSIGLKCSCLLFKDMTGTALSFLSLTEHLFSAWLILVASAICLSSGSLNEDIISNLKASFVSPFITPLWASRIWSHMKEDDPSRSGSTELLAVLEAFSQSFTCWPALVARVLLDSPIYNLSTGSCASSWIWVSLHLLQVAV